MNRLRSINLGVKNIKEIKDDYEIYPGHGELTTLIQEKLNNPYLQ